MTPWFQARLLAVKRRLAIRLKGEFDPYPAPPAAVDLSPSLAHSAAYASVPLALSWPNAGIADATEWQRVAREKLASLSGFQTVRTEPVARFPEEHAVEGGLVRQHVYLRVRDGADLPVDIVWRGDQSGPAPIMICLQGTNAGAHLSWGEARMPADPIKIANGGDYARQAATRGFIAVCIEQSCFGERRERRLRSRSADPCIDAANHAMLLGRSLLGERASDVSAVVDWLTAAVSDICPAADPGRIYAMGSSAGGSTALIATALDERIDGVLASGCIGFIRETIAARGDSAGQNVIPGILNWLELDDVVRLVAPRPLLAISGTADHIWPFDGARAVVDSARDLYTILGRPDAVRAVAGDAGHRFYPALAWPAFESLL